jgi:hypothetical protein
MRAAAGYCTSLRLEIPFEIGPPPVPRPSPQGTPEGPSLSHPARPVQTALRLAPGRAGGAAAAGGGGGGGRSRRGRQRAFEFPIRT